MKSLNSYRDAWVIGYKKMGGKIILKKPGGGGGLVHDQNRGKVHQNIGSGSCPFRGVGKG